VVQVAIGTISAKGQITIPVSVRKKMALKSGDKVLFEEKPEGFSITKINDIFELRGRFGPAIPGEKERELMEKGISNHATGKEQ